MTRLKAADVVRMLVVWLLAAAALGTAVWLIPGVEADGFGPLVACAAVAGVVGALVRPALVEVAAAVGWVAVAVLAVIGQAVVMQVALEVVPGISSESFWATLAAAWIAAAVGTALAWLTAAGTSEALVTSLLRAGRRHRPVPDPDVEGVVFVQLDGVPFPVMRWVLQSGMMPTLRRWVESGSHALQEWTVQMPCTTPASQQGILHGTCARVPAFRWWDRELGRLLVANRPGDAPVIEGRASNGRGLLADDGISVSNLFTGDAPRSAMTMSRVSLTRGSRETRRAFAWFVLRPDGFARSLARSAAEVARERFQAARQRHRDMRPRVHRSWTFAVLRAVSNGLLRDMNTAVVADEMLRGTRAVYVDYVDYDEVAHHAGVVRLEALEALVSLDQVLAVLERVAEAAPRRYRFVVLSDHGQSQGVPFAQRYTVNLADLCARLVEQGVSSIAENVESWGRVEALVDDLAADQGAGGGTARRVSRNLRRHTDQAAREDTAGCPLVVLGSGNLGLVYVKGPERLSLERLDDRWPRLVRGLAEHPGVGFVAVLSDVLGPVAIGAHGVHNLVTGEVTGVDPLADLGPHAPGMLATAVRMPEAPELYVNSIVDESTEEVAAFEDLVGCHGGLGGWQDHGMLVAPVDLLPPGDPIVGAEQLHLRLVSMLETLGHRRHVGPARDLVQP